VIGLAATLFGALPRLLAIPWLVLIYGSFVGLFGDMVQLPGWMFNLSPYEHVPDLPGGSVEPLSIAILALLALLLIVVGQWTFRYRDLEMN
jgi:ABC-2 type transport system permease protein